MCPANPQTRANHYESISNDDDRLSADLHWSPDEFRENLCPVANGYKISGRTIRWSQPTGGNRQRRHQQFHVFPSWIPVSPIELPAIWLTSESGRSIHTETNHTIRLALLAPHFPRGCFRSPWRRSAPGPVAVTPALAPSRSPVTRRPLPRFASIPTALPVMSVLTTQRLDNRTFSTWSDRSELNIRTE